MTTVASVPAKQVTLVAGRLAILLVALPLGFSLMTMAQEPCAIAGRVVDEAGKPIPFAVVHALRGQSFTAQPESPSVAAGSAANHRGEYCLRGLGLGDYLVRAMARTHPPSASPSCHSCCSASTDFQTTLYRSPRAPGRASTVSVGKRRTLSGVDIQMRRVPTYCVHGEVRDTQGSLLSQAAIAVEQGSWSSAVLNEGGRFLLTGLASGSYTILILDRPQLGRVLARRIVHVRAANLDGLVINVASSFR
jgi:hypothetical protein